MKRFAIISFLALVLVLFARLSLSAQTVYVPVDAVDTGIVSNDSQAYDTLFTTAAWVNISDGNITFYPFNVGPIDDTIQIYRVDVLIDVRVNGTSDDTWAIQYSNNSGSTWHDLRSAATGDVERQNLTYLDVGGSLLWSDFASGNFQIAIVTNSIDMFDGASMDVYEVMLRVMYDAVGPNITLLAPSAGDSFAVQTINFTYIANDTLSGVENCSLLINGSVNYTNSSVNEEVTQLVSVNFTEGAYAWNISCYDNSTAYHQTISSQRLFTVDLFVPTINATEPAAASTTRINPIQFNFSVTDFSVVSNCTLLINGTQENVTLNPDKNGLITINLSLSSAVYNWSVNCSDEFGHTNVTAGIVFTHAVNTAPSVDAVALPTAIDLSVGSLVPVTCNATVSDPDGLSELSTVQAVFHAAHYGDVAVQNAYKYENTSCTLVGNDSTVANYTCGFAVASNALAGEWYCNVTATDVYAASAVSFNTTTMNTLFAMNITPLVLDYGLLEAGQNSTSDVIMTVTNVGNAEIDITLDGYAQFDGDGYAMNCTKGNISVEYERYSLTAGQNFAVMTPLTDEMIQLDDFNLVSSNDSFDAEKNVYWKIGVPSPKKGNCTGFVQVTLVQS